jgi:rubrerythrin
MQQALRRLDALTQKLIEADQTGSGLEPLAVARELGQIRQLLAQAPAVIPATGGQHHFRCEQCGTITHGAAAPAKCATCGGKTFFSADLEQPAVESAGG